MFQFHLMLTHFFRLKPYETHLSNKFNCFKKAVLLSTSQLRPLYCDFYHCVKYDNYNMHIAYTVWSNLLLLPL